MPSAYTAILGETEDMKLKDFAMLCARNFGALMCMRDEPLSAPIPERFEPEPYFKESLDKAQKDYDDFIALSDEEKVAYLERQYSEMVESNIKDHEKSNKKKDVLRRRYNAMLLKVVKWNPPTPEHVNLKEFMIKQIHDSIKWDCSEYKAIIPDKEVWCNVKRQVEMRKNTLKICREAYEKHIKAVASQNKWLSDLRESLKDCD